MIGLRGPRRVGSNRVRAGVFGHRCVLVTLVCKPMCGSGRRTEAHRCGSEAFEWQRQQRYPDDQGFKDGFHDAILA